MNYEINVSKDGMHFFATHERSITCTTKLKEVIEVFKEKFPPSQGYQISAMLIKTMGETLDIDDLK